MSCVGLAFTPELSQLWFRVERVQVYVCWNSWRYFIPTKSYFSNCWKQVDLCLEKVSGNNFGHQAIHSSLRWTMPRKRRITECSDSDEDLDDSKHPQRNAANARERARMRVLSKAFCRLKTMLPWVPPDTKLSKLDTLKFATGYITYLRAVLMDQPLPPDYGHKHPLALVSSV